MTSSNCFGSLLLVGVLSAHAEDTADTAESPTPEPVVIDNAPLKPALQVGIMEQTQQVDQLNDEMLNIIEAIRRKKGLPPLATEAPPDPALPVPAPSK